MISPGTQLGHYEIRSAIGKGGMGEVYRATDTKLGREVAIKTLPEEFARDSDRLARFEREARLLASLNHPHIAAIYGLEEHDGARFLVLELVEGPTLADRIAQGAIPVEESLDLALQIAEALEAAHEKGVIHRDLKPANIKLTGDGQVKVLDFGLAKAYAGPDRDARLSQSPTLSMAATQQGMILGTAAYMSPEQARGREVDRRTDIWAFGCVLYEMLTGRAAFPGDDVTDILAAVVRAEPEWTNLPGSVNPRLGELIARCLEKDVRYRWRDIGDVRVEIERVRSDPGIPAGTAMRSRPRVWTWALAAFLIGAALAGLAVSRLAPAPSEGRTVRFSLEVLSDREAPVQAGAIGKVAISPDGGTVAYVATPAEAGGSPAPRARQLYLRDLARADAEARAVPGSAGASSIFFSPDGNWVGFHAEGEIRVASLSGGAPRFVARAFQAMGASWGPDDTIVFGGAVGTGLMQVPAGGGPATPLTRVAPGELMHGLPEFLPRGRDVLFTIGSGAGSRIAIVSLETGEWRELGLAGAGARYLPGYLVFSQGSSLRLIRFDPDRLEVAGSPLPVEDNVQWENWAGLAMASFAVSRAGDLVFVPGVEQISETRLAWVDPDGTETVIDTQPGFYLAPKISPGGARIAVIRLNALGVGEVWVMNADGTGSRPVAADGADYNPAWSTNGRTVTYTSDGDLYEIDVDEDRPRREFLIRENYQMPRQWSGDDVLVYVEISNAGSTIWTMPRDGQPERLLDDAFDSGSPRFAPGGGWIAYASDETGQDEVYIRRFPGAERGRSVAAGREPVWSRDGRTLFFRDGNKLMAVAVTPGPDLRWDPPVELWDRAYFSQEFLLTNYDVAPDGRFLMVTLPDAEQPVTAGVEVVLNWLSSVDARIAGD